MIYPNWEDGIAWKHDETEVALRTTVFIFDRMLKGTTTRPFTFEKEAVYDR